MIKKDTIESFRIFTETILRKAGKILLQEQGKAKIVNQKDMVDIATTADIKSEKLLISEILNKYPNHNIFSEEIGSIKGRSKFTWYIDPLDGTKEYIHNIPLFNCSMLLEYDNESVVSGVYRPTSDTMYSSGVPIGSYMNGKKIVASKLKNIKRSFVYVYPPSYQKRSDRFDTAWDIYKTINKNVYRLRTMQDENSGLCWLAHGGHQAYINISNPPKAWHDIGPGCQIAREAGAVITDDKGNTVNENNYQSIVAASNKVIHSKLMKLINS